MRHLDSDKQRGFWSEIMRELLRLTYTASVVQSLMLSRPVRREVLFTAASTLALPCVANAEPSSMRVTWGPFKEMSTDTSI